MIQPDARMIRLALFQAAHSPCRSKRGVVIYADTGTGPVMLGAGHNGPPRGGECPGRAICAGTCGQRSVHAELRAIRDAYRRGYVSTALGGTELVHVELGAEGSVAPCEGPGCWQCSREILDAGFIAGVWLYQTAKSVRGRARPEDLFVRSEMIADGVRDTTVDRRPPQWVRYTAPEFHRVTLQNCGIPTGGGSL